MHWNSPSLQNKEVNTYIHFECDNKSDLKWHNSRVVVGENRNFSSFAEGIMADAKVDVNLLQDEECITMMRDFIQNNGELWNEDIHEI